jgi:putative ABC transport system substrate-binding protein
MLTRIIVVFLVCLVHSSLGLAQAQQAKKVARIGYLSLRSPPPPSAPLHRYDEALYQGLREVGYTEGKNLIIEYRYSEGKPERFSDLATELVSSKIDLIVAPTIFPVQPKRKR